MTTLLTEGLSLKFTDNEFIVTLPDGREVISPFTADTFPRLWHATPEERACYETWRDEIHWPDLNEDVRIPDLLNGIDNSGESKKSVAQWLAAIQEFRKSPYKGVQTFTEWDLGRQGLWRETTP
ncbi:MAG: DUF2442 domain-containing protein [Chloroflexota bacterium]|nr:DUF2442 domain-containing protein [Chloroflexota bacterium]MDE2961812.1 DUF2442 domain-containing protein [Chloroflexota bacterium]